MNLREEIKKVLASKKNTETHENIDLLKKYKYVINFFIQKILTDALCSENQNDLSGTFNFGALAPSYSFETLIKGETKRKLFTNITVWEFSIDADSPEMMRYEAIEQYADNEDIAIDIEMYHINPENREFKFDLSEFPKITVTATGKTFSRNMNLLYLKDLRLSINYSLSLE